MAGCVRDFGPCCAQCPFRSERNTLPPTYAAFNAALFAYLDAVRQQTRNPTHDAIMAAGAAKEAMLVAMGRWEAVLRYRMKEVA